MRTYGLTTEELGRAAVEDELDAFERAIDEIRGNLEAGEAIGQASVDAVREAHGRLLIAGSVWNANLEGGAEMMLRREARVHVAKAVDAMIVGKDCRP